MDAETWPYVNEGGLGRGYHSYQLKKHKKLVYKMGPLLLESFGFMVKKFSKVKEQTSFPNGAAGDRANWPRLVQQLCPPLLLAFFVEWFTKFAIGSP